MTESANGAGRKPVPVMITAPIGDELAAKVAAAFPGQIALTYRPDLMFTPRYSGDYHGPKDWTFGPGQEAEWVELLRGAEVLLDFDDQVGQPPLALSPNLRWVQTTSAGVGQAVKRLGLQDSDVIVTTASGIHARPLTEFVFAALLFHVKRIAHLQAEQRAHHWERYSARELSELTIAVIGLGRIGRETARIARAFGMTVWGMGRVDRSDRATTDGVDRVFTRAELPEMLAGADCVVLAVPHTPATENLLGREELARLKPDAVLVNIARGVVIDEDALIEQLQAGKLGLAALDVFRTEPLPADSPLWDLPNVLINPHSASTADGEPAKIIDRFIENLGHYLAGEPDQMSPILDKQQLY